MELIKTSEELPAEYTDTLVLHNGVKRVLRHEGGWWYGVAEDDSPELWFKCDALTASLAEAYSMTPMKRPRCN